MKALYIYNPHSANELLLIERAKSEMDGYVMVISIDDVAQDIKNLVRATPTLIIVSDDLQGEELTKEGVDGNLLSTAILCKRLEEEELAVHQSETYRLDNFVKGENIKAIDNFTMDLILGGVI